MEFCLGLAFVVVTVATGLGAYYSVDHDTPSHTAMTNHRNWALLTATVFALIGVWTWLRRRGKSQPDAVMMVILLIAGGLLVTTAFKGGELVYRHGLGVMALPESQGPGHSHSHENGGHDEDSQPEESGHSDGDHEHSAGDHEHDQSSDPSKETGENTHDHPDGDSHGDNKASVPDSESAAAVNAFRTALSSGDKKTVMTLLAPDVLIFESGGAERSRDEYESHHMPADMAFLQEMSTTVTQQRDYQSEDFALIVTESRTRGMYQDQKIDLAGTETIMLEKRGDEWKIVHIHWSSRPAK